MRQANLSPDRLPIDADSVLGDAESVSLRLAEKIACGQNCANSAVTSLAMMRAFAADKAIQLGTAAFGFGGKAASLIVPRRRSSASLSARSSFSSGGT